MCRPHSGGTSGTRGGLSLRPPVLQRPLPHVLACLLRATSMPTSCAGWAIQRIRQFYMRKVKFTQQNWHDKLTQILDDFPKVGAVRAARASRLLGCWAAGAARTTVFLARFLVRLLVGA